MATGQLLGGGGGGIQNFRGWSDKNHRHHFKYRFYFQKKKVNHLSLLSCLDFFEIFENFRKFGFFLGKFSIFWGNFGIFLEN
jgi:hypothetical protein